MSGFSEAHALDGLGAPPTCPSSLDWARRLERLYGLGAPPTCPSSLDWARRLERLMHAWHGADHRAAGRHADGMHGQHEWHPRAIRALEAQRDDERTLSTV